MEVITGNKIILTDRKIGSKALQNLYPFYKNLDFNVKTILDPNTQKNFHRLLNDPETRMYLYVRNPRHKLISSITQAVKNPSDLSLRLAIRHVAPQLLPDPEDFLVRYAKTNKLRNTYNDILSEIFHILLLDKHLSFNYYSYVNYVVHRLKDVMDRVTFIDIDNTDAKVREYLESIEVINPTIVNTSRNVYDIEWLRAGRAQPVVDAFLEPYLMMWKTLKDLYPSRWSSNPNYVDDTNRS